MLSEAKEIQMSTLASSSLMSEVEKGKTMCYSGICQLVDAKIQSGVQCLEEALSFLNDSSEHEILKIVILQILVAYYQFENDSSRSTFFYKKIHEECKALRDQKLLIISPLENQGKETDKEKEIRGETTRCSISH